MCNPFLPIFFILFHIWRIVLSDSVKMEACAPVKCGTVDISYPLWIPEQQAGYCGYPTLEIDCRDDKPFLVQSYDTNYYIDRVFYDNSSFVLVNSFLVNWKSNCSVPRFNVSLGLGPMVVSKINKELVFFFNCGNMSTPPGEYQPVKCDTALSDAVSNDSFVRLFEYYNDGVTSVPGESLSNCSISRIPVSGWNGSGVGHYTTLMNDGFLVELKVTSCSDCRKSGGQCGFNNSTNMFMCICSDDDMYPMSCPNSKAKKEDAKKIILIGLIVAAALALIIILVLLSFKYERGCIFQRKHQEQTEIEMLIEKYGSFAPKRYNYRELKKITKSFQDKLGKGGFGTVYKGSLGDGRFVAVKFLHNATRNGEEFLNEVISIGRTSHVNVVNLLGFCIEGSKRALIYEYMPNGSLDSYIYSEISRDVLGWEKLYDIAISIARGIEYLHRGCNTRIVHFDIKPQNILLDEDFCPKISDFGLAKLFQPKESIISLAEMRGTVGYIAPEVFSRSFGVPSTKSDVYSYGMMVLEMVGGKNNPKQIVASSSKDYFPHWIYDRVADGGNIQTWDVTVETEGIVRKMAMVGLWCIQTLPANRPSMSGVVEMLEKSLDELEIPPKPFLSSPQCSIILSLNSNSG
ncbi:hypothetical protein LUZ63_016337 [Rhynchospora breviuscula]|uniref:non-specific serine/threonine protein kinase n=1 Tax=Rhynchospora breviuscula TaxID=2022672 RepID=A0A9Q0C179_9POAL|nr:hypothetical protein LUZ63_016337 [Rhynchospora breviuscula]